MAIFAKNNSKQFIPAPEGLHQAVCCDLIDMGLQDNKFGPPGVWHLGLDATH